VSKTLRVANGDWAIDSRGRPVWIEEREKAAQDTANVLLQDLTDDGSWGSELGKIEQGAVIDTVTAHRSLVQTLVTEALERLLLLQEQAENIPDLEKIASYNVTVERLPQQSLSYAFYLDLYTEASDEPITKPFVIEIEHVRDPTLSDVVPYTEAG
jgi:hypothetical protein